MADLGFLNLGRGDLATARHWYQQAIEASAPGKVPKARLGLSETLQRLGEHELAAQVLEGAVIHGPAEDIPIALVELGKAYERLGNIERARDRWRDAALSHDDERALEALAELRGTSGRISDAIEAG